MTTPPIVHVTWMDTYAIEDEWYDLGTPQPNRILETTGFLVGQTDNYYHIATTYDTHSNQYSVAIAVYKPSVIERHILRPQTYPKQG